MVTHVTKSMLIERFEGLSVGIFSSVCFLNKNKHFYKDTLSISIFSSSRDILFISFQY